jgi:ABC-type uncharacterized transport system ATPase component
VIKTIDITNYKSVDKLEFELGRVNVFIGENGCGKTNILEAIALAAASAAGKLENEFLLSRGIRATEPVKMRSGFTSATATKPINVTLRGDAPDEARMVFLARLQHDNSAYGQWTDKAPNEVSLKLSQSLTDGIRTLLTDAIEKFADAHTEIAALGLPSIPQESAPRDVMASFLTNAFRSTFARKLGLSSFIIYTPTEEALRDLSRESHVEPIGLHGEGLFKLLSNLTAEQLEELQKYLGLIHWFDGLQVLHGAAPSLNAINIVDQYLGEGIAKFDQRSANEGFLFLLLYASLLVSSHTPKFFAVDNVDAALNPKLSAGVIRMFVEATKKHDRQVLLTTHNPGALDGLDLQDPEQRLFVVYRNLDGRTRVRRIEREAGEDLPRLSEAFLQGNLGGLPNHF